MFWRTDWTYHNLYLSDVNIWKTERRWVMEDDWTVWLNMRWRTVCHYGSRADHIVESWCLRPVDTCVGLDLRRLSQTAVWADTEIATARNSGPFVSVLHKRLTAWRVRDRSRISAAVSHPTWNNSATLPCECVHSFVSTQRSECNLFCVEKKQIEISQRWPLICVHLYSGSFQGSGRPHLDE